MIPLPDGGLVSGAAASKCVQVFTAACASAMVVLGIPILALCAAMLGAAISHIPKQGEPDKAIPARIGGIVADAFIGGWLAVFVLNFRPLEEYGVTEVPVTVIAGLCALLVQFLRGNAKRYFDRAFDAAVEAFNRRFGGVQ